MWKYIRLQNFRGFQDFTLHGLARVNVIAGSNNTGKTSILEAAWLLGCNQSVNLPVRLLSGRGQPIMLMDRQETSWDWLFHRRSSTSPVTIASETTSATVRLTDLNAIPIPQGSGIGNQPASLQALDVSHRDPSGKVNERRLTIRQAASGAGLEVQAQTLRQEISILDDSAYLPATYRNPVEVANWLSELILKKDTDPLIIAMRAIDDRIAGLQIVSVMGTPTVHVDLGDATGLVPLHTLGDGFNRVLHILAAIAWAGRRRVLVDEIENGIFFEALPKVWSAIDAFSARHECQVFATTHSWEAVTAARVHFLGDVDAASIADGKNPDFAYFRLRRDAAGIHADRFPQDRLARMVDAGWEVR